MRLTDRAGRVLISVIDDLNLIILNDYSPTLIQPPGHNQSVINLALASSGIASFCSAILLIQVIAIIFLSTRRLAVFKGNLNSGIKLI